MQVNGMRSCKAVLMHEWNLDCYSHETLRANKMPKILQALGLKVGVMTARQVRQTWALCIVTWRRSQKRLRPSLLLIACTCRTRLSSYYSVV